MNEEVPKAKDITKVNMVVNDEYFGRKILRFFKGISCKNADMLSSVNNLIKLYRKPKVSGQDYFS
jgi:hypothetical protein